MTPPEDPIVSSTTHTPLVWSSSSFVQVSWSGASDGAGSGVAGYSILWDGAPMTVPDTGVDTTGAAASTTRPDGTTHFHLRTKDVAGNWSGATHFGPLGIDTAAPGCTVVALPAYVGLAPFSVKWVSFDAGSGVASYDVQYRDGEGAWTDWHTGTTSNSASFTGDRGHTYAFRCRARDAVGNQGVYPATADTSTRVGRTLTIQVRYGGAPAAGAKVYRNGELLGTTDGGGNLAAPDCVQGDNLAAHHAIYSKPSLKRPADPSWVVYATNVTIPVTGAPQLFVFGDVGASPNPVVIDVDGNRPLDRLPRRLLGGVGRAGRLPRRFAPGRLARLAIPVRRDRRPDVLGVRRHLRQPDGLGLDRLPRHSSTTRRGLREMFGASWRQTRVIWISRVFGRGASRR